MNPQNPAASRAADVAAVRAVIGTLEAAVARLAEGPERALPALGELLRGASALVESLGAPPADDALVEDAPPIEAAPPPLRFYVPINGGLCPNPAAVIALFDDPTTRAALFTPPLAAPAISSPLTTSLATPLDIGLADPAKAEAIRRGLEALNAALRAQLARLLARLSVQGLVGASVPVLIGALGVVLIVGVPVGFAIALRQALGAAVNPAMLLVAALVSRLIERLFDDLDYGLSVDEEDCFRACAQRLMEAVVAAFAENDAFGQFPSTRQRGRIVSAINDALLAFERCLTKCGIILNEEQIAQLWALLSAVSTLLFGFGGEGPGDLDAKMKAFEKRARNGLRASALKKGVGVGHHRRGGFTYGELGDDRADAPDITEEDATEAVDGSDVTVDPEAMLDGFTGARLTQRKGSLEDFADATLESLKALHEALKATAEPRRRETLRRGISQAARQFQRQRLALRRTLQECAHRAALKGERAKAERLLRKASTLAIDPPRPAR